MLDASNPLPVSDAEVLAWTDLGSLDVVWALPARPRLATAADGQPDVTLMLYRRGQNSPPDGGQLTLTVDLALTETERMAAAAAGEARRPLPPDRDAPPLPPVQVRTPTWTEAQVHAEPVPGLTAEGKPSLMGDNSCMLTLQLDAAQAADVQSAWDDGFPEGTVELRGTVDGGYSAAATATVSGSTTTSTSTTSTTGPDEANDAAGGDGCGDDATTSHAGRHSGSASQLRVTVAAAATGAVGVPLHLHGPLRVPTAVRAARRTDLTL